MAKREPLLIDRLLGKHPVVTPLFAEKDSRTVTQVLRAAKRYTFDAESVKVLARIVSAHPLIQIDALDFAIQPYPHMWIEMPTLDFWEGLDGNPAVINHEQRTGYLITNGTIYTISLDRTGRQLEFTPAVFEMFQPFKSLREMDAYYLSQGIAHSDAARHFMGSTSPSFMADPLKTAGPLNQSALTLQTLTMFFHRMRISMRPETIEHHRQHGGSLINPISPIRTVLAALILLNRTQDITYRRDEVVPTKPGFVGTKLGMYNGHTVIKFICDPDPMIKQLFSTPGLTGRPLHEVAGHFCFNKDARESLCSHGDWKITNWKEFDGGRKEARQWRCGGCGGLKWWREYHLRGDPKYGIQTSEYVVTN